MGDQELRARRLILFAVVALLAGTALAWSLFLVRDALQLLYLSLVLALGFSPIVRWIEERRWFGRKRAPRWLAILLFYVILVGVIALTLEIILPPLVTQASDLWSHLPDYLARAQKWLVSHRLMRRAFTMAELIERTPGPNAAMSGIVGAVNQVIGFVLTGFTVLLVSFYLLVEGPGFFKDFLRWLPADSRPAWSRVASDVALKVGAWMSGQFVLCVLIGTSAGIGFWLIGLPYFYVLALICGIGELIPIIGPVIAAVPAILVASTVSANAAIIATIFMFVQQQIENNIIIPRLMQKQTGISALVVIAAILIGGSLLGVLGALLAVPTAAIIQILVREYLNMRDAA